MSDDYYRTHLRFPPELADKIKQSAEENDRSFNKEVMHRLERSFIDWSENSSPQFTIDKETASEFIGSFSERLEKEFQHRLQELVWLSDQRIRESARRLEKQWEERKKKLEEQQELGKERGSQENENSL